MQAPDPAIPDFKLVFSKYMGLCSKIREHSPSVSGNRRGITMHTSIVGVRTGQAACGDPVRRQFFRKSGPENIAFFLERIILKPVPNI